MKKNLFILFIVLIYCVVISFAQTSPEINLLKIDYRQIESSFYQKLNKLREEKGVGKLSTDAILKLAADDQAAYMDSTKVVGHVQKIKKKENPHNRVMFYKGTHDHVGENCIQIVLKKPMKTKYSKTLVTANTYEQAAEALFLGWKNSPGHYKNMIEPSYDVAGLGFSFSPDSSTLYCAQVFSAKPYIQPKGLESPVDAYGIKAFNQKTCEVFNSEAFEHVAKTMMLVIGEDSVYLRSEDYLAMKAFFSKPQDAIYLDVVLREQFVCENNNLLHGSEMYDGTMLPPAYFKDLFRRNTARGEKNFFAVLSAIPPQFKSYRHAINSALVKENVSCKYRFCTSVPGENLETLPLYPKWIKLPNENIPADTFRGELHFSIPFERGKTSLTENQQIQLLKRLQIYKPFLRDVTIKTYSSIEGATALNLKIQQQRAEALKSEIEKVTGKRSDIQIESKENWDDFYKQIENSPYSYLKDLKKEEIKELLKNKFILEPIDYLLKKTRIAQVTVKLEARIDNNSHPYIIVGAYKKAVEAGDSLKSFRYQNRLVQAVLRGELEHSDVTQVELPFQSKFLAHWTNYVALATFNPALVYTHETREKAIHAMNLDTTFVPLQFNMCITTLKFINDYRDTLMSIPMLERKMKNSFLMRTKEDSILVKKIMLNYHIISAYHHWLRHEYDKIDEHLQFIQKYFEVQLLTEAEAIKLGLLFNIYGRYTWTCDMLAPYVKKGTQNEDLLFLFVETNVFYETPLLTQEEWLVLVQKAKTMNPKRFYDWIDGKNFQLMRTPYIKKEFCTIHPKQLKQVNK